MLCFGAACEETFELGFLIGYCVPARQREVRKEVVHAGVTLKLSKSEIDTAAEAP